MNKAWVYGNKVYDYNENDDLKNICLKTPKKAKQYQGLFV